MFLFRSKRDKLSQLVVFRSSPCIPVKVLHQTNQPNDLREVFSQIHGVKFTEQLNLYAKHLNNYDSIMNLYNKHFYNYDSISNSF